MYEVLLVMILWLR